MNLEKCWSQKQTQTTNLKLNFVLQEFLTIIIILQEIVVTKTHREENHLGRCFMIHVGDQDWNQVRYAWVPTNQFVKGNLEFTQFLSTSLR